MIGAWLGSQASKNPRLESTKERPFLHWEGPMPFEPRSCQVAPPSVVCQMLTTSALHCVSGEPPVLSQPSLSLTNEISGCGNPCEGGNGLCCHVAPRSVE